MFAQTDRNDDTGGQLSVADLDLDNRLKRKYFYFKKSKKKLSNFKGVDNLPF